MSLSNNVKQRLRSEFSNRDAAAALISAVDTATATNGTQATAITAAAAAAAAAQATADTASSVAFKDEVVLIPIEDLAAGADIAARPVYVNPLAGTLISIGILAQGSYAGVDAGNTMVVAITDAAANSIVSKTFDNVTVPTNSGFDDLGTLDVTHKILTASEIVKVAITNGATANPPGLFLVLRFRPTAV